MQCNGKAVNDGTSDKPLVSTSTVSANTAYELVLTYDKTIATMTVNNVMEVSAAKNFNYPRESQGCPWGWNPYNCSA